MKKNVRKTGSNILRICPTNLHQSVQGNPSLMINLILLQEDILSAGRLPLSLLQEIFTRRVLLKEMDLPIMPQEIIDRFNSQGMKTLLAETMRKQATPIIPSLTRVIEVVRN